MKKYPMVKQEGEKDCGVASLLMLIKYYNGYISMEELRDMTKTTKDGTTAYHLVNTLKEVGFDAYGVECPFDNINNTNIILPCIAHVIIDNSYKHFIVIYEINLKKDYLIIADPATKVKKIKIDEFQKIFNNVLIFAQPIKTIPYINYRDYSFLFTILKNHTKLFKQLIILSIFITLFAIINSFFFEKMINGINTNSKSYLLFIFIIFFSINILRIITDYFRNKVLIYINQKIDLDLTIDVFNKIIMLPYQYYRNRTTGEILSRINDLSLVREMISKVALSLFIDLPLAFVSLFVLLLINKTLFIIAFIIMLLYFLLVLIFRPIYKKRINKVHKKKADSTSFMVEAVSGFETVKGLHIEKEIMKKFEYKYACFLDNVFKYQRCFFFEHTLKELINDIGFIIIIFIGCLLVMNNQLTLGTLLTFNALLTYFLAPIRNIIDLDSNIKESASAIKRVSEMMKKEEVDGVVNSKLNGNIIFKNLTYSFNDRDIILKNINLKIKNGSKTMVIGKSGSGKSTLFKLLMKYYSLGMGKIFINDIDINNITKKSIDDNIIYLNQNEVLFNDTIYNNINVTNNKKLDFEKITKICYVDEIIKDSLGYNMVIEENGFNLSGGERQRIILARTLLKPFNILIIDEGLNQVDINLERKILKNMFKKFEDKTIIVISHRLENIDLFDNLIELKHGKIVRSKKKNEGN